MLKVAIIGCGGIANGKHMPALENIKEIEMVGFADIVEERADKALKRFGTKNSKAYSDYNKMLDEVKPDIVYVCTPNSTHSKISIDAMKKGSHVMCEKPMAINTKEAEEMIEASKKYNRKLTIGYQNRFRKDSILLKQIVDNNELGNIYYAKAIALRRRAVPTWGVFLDEKAQGGGPLIDIGTHALDLTLYMMNNYDVDYVVGTTYRTIAKYHNSANEWGPWDPEKYTAEDLALGFIKMKNGSTIILESSWALNTLQVEEAKTTLHGDKAGADMTDGLRINGESYGELFTKKYSFDSAGVAFYDGESQKETDVEARTFIKAVLDDREVLVKPEEALIVTKILEAIYESSKINKPIYFD